MRRRLPALAAALLAGCAQMPASSAPASVSSLPAQASSAPAFSEPAWDLDLGALALSDFSDAFSQEYPTEVASYSLLGETALECRVVTLSGEHPGPAVYLVAGVHGDEPAGTAAAELLKSAALRAGTLYILSPANVPGASADPPRRTVRGDLDLNRSFPGDARGDEAQRLAAAIFDDIARVKPDLLLDLHEARDAAGSQDFLGRSVIYSRADGREEFLFSLLDATQKGLLAGAAFDAFSPAPSGSINRAVSDELEIFALTIETYRGDAPNRRVADQLALAGYILQRYGMI